MSLNESGYSSGDVSLIELFDGSLGTKGVREIHLSELVDYVVRGGGPGSQELRSMMRRSDHVEPLDGFSALTFYFSIIHNFL